MGFLENLFQTTMPGECTGKKVAPKAAPAAPTAPEQAQPVPTQAESPKAAPAQPAPVQPEQPKAAPAQPAVTPAQPAPVQAEPPKAAPVQPAPAQPQAQPAGQSAEKILEEIMTPSNFPGYTLYQDVHPGVMDATAHPKSRHITYLFRLNGEPKLAVFLLERSQERSMPTVGTCRILEARGIPCMMFFHRERYNPEVVLQSIRRKLSRR